MFEQLTQYGNFGFVILRIAVAIVFIYHAVPKLKNAKGMAQMVGMPVGMIVMLGVIELISSVGLVFGVYPQLAALLLIVAMIGAIGMKTMKWKVPFAASDKTGWEFDFVLLAANILILLTGGQS